MPFGFLMILPPLFKQHNPKVPSDMLTRTPDVYLVLQIQLLAIILLCQDGERPPKKKKKKKKKGTSSPQCLDGGIRARRIRVFSKRD